MISSKLSIVIPSHNRIDLLRLCLKSVTEFAPSDTEIIVVDDGSDESQASGVALGFGLAPIRNARPLGFARAANLGIAAANGAFIELLNDDTQVTYRWADAALPLFEDPSVAAVAPLVLQGPNHDPIPTIDSAGDEYDIGGFAQKRGRGQRLSQKFLSPCEVFGASASSAFFRASVLRDVGAFPESFGAYFEDVDLAWRIQNAGFRTLYQPTSVVWHRVGSSYRQRRSLLEMQSRNEEFVYWRNVPGLWRAFPRHVAVLGGKALRRIREGTFMPFALGRLRAIVETIRRR